MEPLPHGRCLYALYDLQGGSIPVMGGLTDTYGPGNDRRDKRFLYTAALVLAVVMKKPAGKGRVNVYRMILLRRGRNG